MVQFQFDDILVVVDDKKKKVSVYRNQLLHEVEFT